MQSGAIGMRSPLARVSVLLSSSTLLRFSIQMASTGPSSTSQMCSPFLALCVLLQRVEKMPSVQSLVATSRRPNIWGAGFQWKESGITCYTLQIRGPCQYTVCLQILEGLYCTVSLSTKGFKLVKTCEYEIHNTVTHYWTVSR